MATKTDLRAVLREIRQHAGPAAPSPLDPALLRKSVRAIRAAYSARKRPSWMIGSSFTANVGRGQFSSQRTPWRVTIRRLAPYLLDLMPDLTKGQAEGIARSIQLGLRSDAPDSEVAEMIEQYGVEPERAILIARTEMARARADTELGRLKPNERVVYVLADGACPKCVKVKRKLKERRLTAKQAQGIVPVHPNCYCRWKTVNVRSGREVVRNDANGFEQVRSDVLEFARTI